MTIKLKITRIETIDITVNFTIQITDADTGKELGSFVCGIEACRFKGLTNQEIKNLFLAEFKDFVSRKIESSSELDFEGNWIKINDFLNQEITFTL